MRAIQQQQQQQLVKQQHSSLCGTAADMLAAEK
jgi:hypothetical protein